MKKLPPFYPMKQGIFTIVTEYLNLAMLVASLPTVYLNFLFKFCITLGARARLIPSGGQDFLWVASMMLISLSLFAFAYFVFCWAVSFLVLWAMRAADFFTEWPIEYRADKFALDMGFAPAMITLLESIEDVRYSEYVRIFK